NFDDRKHLPFVEALMIREVTRMHPAAPTGIPHITFEDDVHDGYYFIPKGSIIFANIWRVCLQMAHDRSVYTKPFLFDSERFMGPNPEQHPFEYLFGFGRSLLFESYRC
ncbi:cytochrome P450, partial [Hymenopellis radicata]